VLWSRGRGSDVGCGRFRAAVDSGCEVGSIVGLDGIAHSCDAELYSVSTVYKAVIEQTLGLQGETSTAIAHRVGGDRV
jgi:hypothetical protein